MKFANNVFEPLASNRGPYLKETAMLSARNQLPATVKSVKLGNVMAEVVMDVAGIEVVSAITRGSAEALKLQAGDKVKAVIKATEVLVEKP
jgi:molybdopterin-binding protein